MPSTGGRAIRCPPDHAFQAGGWGSGRCLTSGPAGARYVADADVGTLDRGAEVPVHLVFQGALPVDAERRPVVIGVAGARGAGKTTLIERLIPALVRCGVSAACIKHHAHQQAVDEEGTDTARAAAAGAVRTILAGPGGLTVRVPAATIPRSRNCCAPSATRAWCWWKATPCPASRRSWCDAAGSSPSGRPPAGRGLRSWMTRRDRLRRDQIPARASPGTLSTGSQTSSRVTRGRRDCSCRPRRPTPDQLPAVRRVSPPPRAPATA